MTADVNKKYANCTTDQQKKKSINYSKRPRFLVPTTTKKCYVHRIIMQLIFMICSGKITLNFRIYFKLKFCYAEKSYRISARPIERNMAQSNKKQTPNPKPSHIERIVESKSMSVPCMRCKVASKKAPKCGCLNILGLAILLGSHFAVNNRKNRECNLPQTLTIFYSNFCSINPLAFYISQFNLLFFSFRMIFDENIEPPFVLIPAVTIASVVQNPFYGSPFFRLAFYNIHTIAIDETKCTLVF